METQGKLEVNNIDYFPSLRFNPDLNQVYFKPDNHRQAIELPGGYSTDIEDEYNAMDELYRACPDLVAEPYCLSHNHDGYFMEFIEGETLHDALDNIDFYDVETILSDINEFGNLIKEEETPHGDIHLQNFMLEEDSSISAIDAAGIPEGLEAPGFGTLKDQALVWDITDINENIIDPLSSATSEYIHPEDYYVEHPVQKISTPEKMEKDFSTSIT